jgi:hypothetical protein
MDEKLLKKCPICGLELEGVRKGVTGEFTCGRCRTTGRYEGESLTAIDIPGYHSRLSELEARNRELIGEIELEGIKGQQRDMRYLQRKHLERQDVLCEYAFLSHFEEFVRKW